MHSLRITKPLFQPLQLKEQHLKGAIMKQNQHSEELLKKKNVNQRTVEIERFG